MHIVFQEKNMAVAILYCSFSSFHEQWNIARIRTRFYACDESDCQYAYDSLIDALASEINYFLWIHYF